MAHQPDREPAPHTQAPVARDELYRLECAGIPTLGHHENLVEVEVPPALESPDQTEK
jgi:hypothetical protein